MKKQYSVKEYTMAPTPLGDRDRVVIKWATAERNPSDSDKLDMRFLAKEIVVRMELTLTETIRFRDFLSEAIEDWSV